MTKDPVKDFIVNLKKKYHMTGIIKKWSNFYKGLFKKSLPNISYISPPKPKRGKPITSLSYLNVNDLVCSTSTHTKSVYSPKTCAAINMNDLISTTKKSKKKKLFDKTIISGRYEIAKSAPKSTPPEPPKPQTGKQIIE